MLSLKLLQELLRLERTVLTQIRVSYWRYCISSYSRVCSSFTALRAWVSSGTSNIQPVIRLELISH
jgi:hypothetical protein